ncbi:hypothetical protein MRX96_024466 [Rhipicephalus microplus]
MGAKKKRNRRGAIESPNAIPRLSSARFTNYRHQPPSENASVTVNKRRHPTIGDISSTRNSSSSRITIGKSPWRSPFFYRSRPCVSARGKQVRHLVLLTRTLDA